jgi:hypothetical protein
MSHLFCCYAMCHYDECRLLSVVMLGVVMLNVVMLSVIMRNVEAPFVARSCVLWFSIKSRQILGILINFDIKAVNCTVNI